MNILLFSWRGPKHPHAGGAEISTHEHAKGWVKVGHKVTLFTSMYTNAKELEYLDGVRIIRRGSEIFGVQIAALKWFLFESKEQFDIVIDQFHGIPFFTPLFVKNKKMAFIHEVTKEVWQLNSWQSPLNLLPTILGTNLEQFVFKLLYKSIPFITVSESTKKDLIAWGIPKDNIYIVKNGINNSKIKKLPQKETKKTAIFLGSLSKDKGIEDALYIFKQIYEQDSDWQFWIVGKSDSKYIESIKNLARKLGVYRKINFFGFVSEDKKFDLLSRAHILVNPSIREGWGLVVIEAASVGTPTVGYNVAGLKDSVINGSTGILCDINPNNCSSAIISLMSNKKEYERLRENCFEWGGQFTWDKSIKTSLELIENLVNK